MTGCLSEDDLLDLVQGKKRPGDLPGWEGHLGDCSSCSSILASLARRVNERAPETLGRFVGRALGPYRLISLLGAGGMGEVYAARDERLARQVAVKVMFARPESSDVVRRAEAEARASARIAHPNVVTVHDVGEVDGLPFIVSELVSGQSLRSLIEARPFAYDLAIRLGLGLARGLAAAHAEGVIHRDLKPHNLIVADDGTIKILDFGLAKLTQAAEEKQDITLPGAVVGTIGYLAPEQARGEPADARSDVFAVGAILYEMIVGERAFGGVSHAERLSALLRDTPPRLSDGSLGAAKGIVVRCLEKDPARRFQSASDLAWALEGLPASESANAVAKHAKKSAPGNVLRRGPRELETIPEGDVPRHRGTLDRRSALVAAVSVAGGVLLGRLLTPRARLDVAFQQLSFRMGRLGAARFTPEGESVVYAAAWDERPLAVFTTRLAGGGTRELDLPTADVLAVSTRGELALSIDRSYVEGFHSEGRLARVPMEGGVPSIIAERVQEADFLPDGRDVVLIRRAGKVFRIECPPGKVVLETESWPSSVRASPDGRFIAFLEHPTIDDDRGEVMLLEIATRARRSVATGFSSLSGIAWLPKGDGLWFSGALEGGNNAIYASDLRGAPRFVGQTTGRLRLHDLASRGRAAVSHDNWRMCMRVKAPGEAPEVDMSLSDISVATAMTPDGATIAFGEFGDVDPAAAGCYVRATRGGRPQRLGEGSARAISDDGRRVLSQRFDSPSDLVVYSVDGGPGRPLAVAPVEKILFARFRGKNEIVLGGAASLRPPRIWRLDLDGGPARPLTDEGQCGEAFVSPDGTKIAFIDREGRLFLTEVEGGLSPVVIAGNYVDNLVVGFCDDGRSIFVRRRAFPLEVRRVDLTNGRVTPHFELTPPALGRKGLDTMVISAAGDAYAYSYGQELSRLYLMTTDASA